MMGAILDVITSLPAVAAYAVIAALVFGEAAVFIGFVLPGEAAVVFGGFLASQHHLAIVTLCIVVFLAAVLGDSVGFEVGKHFGPRLVGLKLFTRHQTRLDAASDMLRRRGGPAVLLGRFTAFFRAVMPGLAGLSQMKYRTFLVWNALGGLTWGVGFALVGFFVGASYDTVAKKIGTGSALVVGAIVLIAVVVWHVRRRRAGHREEPAHDDVHH